MPGPEPRPGYSPTFAMPIIGSAPAGSDPEDFYTALAPPAGVAVAVADASALRIRMAHAHRTLYAMNGGLIHYEPAAGNGTLVLTTWPLDATRIRRDLPGGMPPPKKIFYAGVSETSVRAALNIPVRWVTVPELYLRQSWRHFRGADPPSGTTVDDLRAEYLNHVMQGDRDLFVPGGAAIGEATPVAGESGIDEFTLRFINAGDNALSPVPYLQIMPRDEYGGEEWTGHPLIAATAAIPIPIDFYVRFEIYDLVDRTFKPLPAGIRVEIVDDDPVDSDVLGPPQNTNADGVVHFGFARRGHLYSLDSDELGGGPDLFFRVRSGDIGLPFAHHTSLPETWSTKGWLGVDDVPGYYENFEGTQIGARDAPAVFRIGVDFHIKLRYFNSNADNEGGIGRWEPALPGIPVRLLGAFHGPNPDFTTAPVHTDGEGAAHGVAFEALPNQDLWFDIRFEVAEDSAINMTAAYVTTAASPTGPLVWITTTDDEDRNHPGPTIYLSNVKTSIASQVSPADFTVRVEERRVALNFLKLYRDWSTVVFKLTGGDFGGISSLIAPPVEIADFSPSGVSFSYPTGRINIATNAHWVRQTIMHENSHQLMWIKADFNIALHLGDYNLFHGFPEVLTELTAWAEGWAEFMAYVFTGERPGLTHVTRDDGATWEPLAPPPQEQGNRVEGAFCCALLAIFDKYVTHLYPAPAKVEESLNGDVMALAANAWLDAPGLADRFRRLLWEPLGGLRGVSAPSALLMAEAMEARNRAEWHDLVLEFQRFNNCRPVIRSITPTSGPAAGGTHTEIKGINFSRGSRIHVGPNLVSASDTIVVDGRTINFVTPPGATGIAEVKIVTTSGMESTEWRFRYV